MKDHIWKIIGVVAVLAIGGSIVYSNAVSQAANEGIVLEAHVKGNIEAAVTLTEYSDFQCPACAQFYRVVKEIMAEQGEDIRFEYKHFPLISIHPSAVPAAKAAEAAGQQGKFFQMHDKLFDNQQVWSAAPNPQSFFIRYAEELGLDMALFRQHMKASVIADKVTNEFNEARDLGLKSTPSFLLNGTLMQFDSYDDFVAQITNAITPPAADEDASAIAPTTTTEPEVRFGF
jgi:protein-disulfide isomerase